MIAAQITNGVYSLRALHWDRKLFDELVPLPDGTTYNAYLVIGSEKTALIDTVLPVKGESLIAALKALGIEKLDYVVANHAEQDHSGSIPLILQHYPEAKVVTNAKCRRFIMDTLPVERDAFIGVSDGQSLSLGDKTLNFMLTPWVHWPDTMITHVPEAGIVFTCDFMGAHLTTTELFAVDEPAAALAAKRYYAEIMMPYRAHSKAALERLLPLKPTYIAPSHGPVHNRPAFITGLYADWTSDAVRPTVLIPFVSMYESTAAMVDHLVDALQMRGLNAKPVNVVEFDSGEFAMHLIDASTVVFASPTVLSNPHPSVTGAAVLINLLAPKTRFAAVMGSFGWDGDLPASIMGQLPRLNATWLEPVMIKGKARGEALEEIDRLANDIARANFGDRAVAA
ncbi:FprA family A-type flavoprotein [Oryzibacter oryziterrae]|uniref:FprA family A-type flavoprotein n=1 Tax=Oryzibacter oryziterrae TaxID=2766474 RepID=UPI001F1DA793|nr:FprA family A-type flavoprotein [Oryzibacter oryziterrae]